MKKNNYKEVWVWIWSAVNLYKSIHQFSEEKCYTNTLYILKLYKYTYIYMFLKRTVFIQCYLKYPPLLSSCPYLQKATHSLSKPSLIHTSFMKFSLNTNSFISFLVINIFKLSLYSNISNILDLSMCPICLY